MTQKHCVLCEATLTSVTTAEISTRATSCSVPPAASVSEKKLLKGTSDEDDSNMGVDDDEDYDEDECEQIFADFRRKRLEGIVGGGGASASSAAAGVAGTQVGGDDDAAEKVQSHTKESVRPNKRGGVAGAVEARALCVVSAVRMLKF